MIFTDFSHIYKKNLEEKFHLFQKSRSLKDNSILKNILHHDCTLHLNFANKNYNGIEV
jgi:hypothetical protein